MRSSSCDRRKPMVMTSGLPTTSPPSPQIFTIFTLPSYEDAIKSSGEPPSYEQSLTDLRVDTLEATVGNSSSQQSQVGNRNSRDPTLVRRKACHRRSYKCVCWTLAILVLLVLGYMIYMGIFRYMTNGDTKT